jgi:hypothetical protein
MRSSRGRALALLCLVSSGGAAFLACHPGRATDDAGAPSASDSASSLQVTKGPPTPLTSGLPGASASARRPTTWICKAASVAGTPHVIPLAGVIPQAPTPAFLTESSDIPEAAWIELDPGAKVTAKHPLSTRETAFQGPGRFRSCVGRAEEAWIEKGKFESVVGSGERPGAEEWLFTPAGVVRYGAAKVDLNVASSGAGDSKTEVKVVSGTAYVWTGDEASAVKPAVPAGKGPAPVADGWTRIEGEHAMTLTLKKPAKAQDAAEAAIARCKTDAKAARDVGMQIANPDANLAVNAPKQVIARHQARAACGVAMLRAYALDSAAGRDAMVMAAREADSEWKGRPRAPHARPH